MKLQLAIILIFIVPFSGWAQTVNRDEKGKIEIGQEMPDVVIPRILNYETSYESFSNLKGKLVILDFWGPNCSSCFKGFSKLQNLQKKFGDKVQVFLVTRTKESKVKDLFSELRILKDINLPIITDDSVLSRFFPYRTVPTHVWIDQKGVVRYKTWAHNTTDSTVALFLVGNPLIMGKKQEELELDAATPLWLEGNGRQIKNLRYYSYIMSRIYDDGRDLSTIEIDSVTKKVARVLAYNRSILELYQLAFSVQDSTKLFIYDKNRIIFDLRQPENMDWPKHEKLIDAWKRNYTYCYEIKVDARQSSKLQSKMQQDLEGFFKIKGRIEKRKILCNVIAFSGDPNLLSKSVFNGPGQIYRLRDGDSTFVNNVPAEVFFKWVARAANEREPIIDETIQANISLAFPATNLNTSAGWEGFVNYLKKYGFRIEKKFRKIDMLILKDVE